MKVTTERVPDSQVVLEIEVEPERVERSLDQAYKRLANRARIPGFRPGKAPRHLIERTYGQEVLMQEALDKLIPEVYKEAVAEQDIDPIDVPNVEVETLDPVKFKATVAVRPTVDLGDYKDSIKVEKSAQAVTDDEVDAEVEVWRKRMATWEPVERTLALGDLIQANVELTVDGKPLVKQEDAEFLFREELEPALPGIVAGMVGMSAGETREFSSTLPDDFRDVELRGVEGTYTVNLKSIKEQKLPDVDDEFAKGAGDGFDDVAAFRAWVREGLQTQKDEEEQSRVEQEALVALVESAKIEYPQVLVEHEVGHLLQERVGGGDRNDLTRQLAAIGKSEEELREELRPAAIDRIKRSVVLNEFARLEDIEVIDGDVEEEISRIARGNENLMKAFGAPQLRDQISRNLLTKKTLARLAEIAAVEGPAPKKRATKRETAEESEPKKPARSRKKPATGDES